MCYFNGQIRRDGLVFSVLDPGRRGLGSSTGGVVVLCSWPLAARLRTRTVPLSAQNKYIDLAECKSGALDCNNHP